MEELYLEEIAPKLHELVRGLGGKSEFIPFRGSFSGFLLRVEGSV